MSQYPKENILNKLWSFEKLFQTAGVRIKTIYHSAITCPFHAGHSKNAKIYPPDSKRDSESLWCFSENKLYLPVDLIKKQLVGISIEDAIASVVLEQNNHEDFFNELLKQSLSFSDIKIYEKDNYSNLGIDQKTAYDFKRGRIKLHDLLKEYYFF